MNARLRTIAISGLLAIGAFSAVTYTSCSEDKCKAIVCAYNGVCTNGTCLCPSGYEGPQCETVNRDRYKGVWQVTEDGTLSAAAQYSVSVENGNAGATSLIIKNFRNYFAAPITASVKGDTMYIDHQTIMLSNNTSSTIDGYGVIMDDKYYGSHGRLEVHYSVTDQNGSVDYYGLSQGNASVWNK